MSEKTPRLRPHERPRGVNPHIQEYAGKLSAPPVCHLSDGRPVHLADPVEDGYVIGAVPPEAASPEGEGLNRDLAEVMERLDNAPGDSLI